MAALRGDNLDPCTTAALSYESFYPNLVEGGNVIRFSQSSLKHHIEQWIKKRTNFIHGVDELKNAAAEGLLHQGQIIFQEVLLSESEDKNGCLGNFFDAFAPILTLFTIGQMRNCAYFHVAIYCGKFKDQHYVVENGGEDDETKMSSNSYNGSIKLETFESAFVNTNARFFIVSPPKDNNDKSTRYLVLQKALASIGVKFVYHIKAVSCETFALAMLGSIDESSSYNPIQTDVIRSHFQNLPSKLREEKVKEHEKRFKKFHQDLMGQILLVPKGSILTLEFAVRWLTTYAKFSSTVNVPWFMEMNSAYRSLFEAAENGNLLICKNLLECGLNLYSRFWDSKTALEIAVEYGHADICCEIIRQLDRDAFKSFKEQNTHARSELLAKALLVANEPSIREMLVKEHNKFVSATVSETNFYGEFLRQSYGIDVRDNFKPGNYGTF